MSIFILSGEREAGKTTFCRTISRKARRQGITVAGIITLTERDKKLTALDLYTEEERTLAEANPLWYKESLPTALPVKNPRTHGRTMERSGMTSPRTHGRAMERSGMTSPRTGRWIFRDETLLWGNVSLKKPEPVDLFILDEVGILEMEMDQGWMEGIKRADRMTDRTILVVVRPELIKRAVKRWPGAVVLTINAENRSQEDKLIEKILQAPR